MDRQVTQTDQGVTIRFTGEVKKTTIVQMVQNCATGQCECMNEATKAKIADMQVDGNDGDVELRLSGDVAKEEIEAALAKSKVINPE